MASESLEEVDKTQGRSNIDIDSTTESPDDTSRCVSKKIGTRIQRVDGYQDAFQPQSRCLMRFTGTSKKDYQELLDKEGVTTATERQSLASRDTEMHRAARHERAKCKRPRHDSFHPSRS